MMEINLTLISHDKFTVFKKMASNECCEKVNQYT